MKKIILFIYISRYLDRYWNQITVADTLLQVDLLEANRRYYWRVSATNNCGTSDYSVTASFMTGDQSTTVDKYGEMPTELKLFQNYPNPFNPATTVSFSLPHKSYVRLVLINVLGEEIINVATGNFEAGVHHVQLDAQRLVSGLYFYKMEAGKFSKVMKMIVSK